jgi:hypothetical protein
VFAFCHTDPYGRVRRVWWFGVAMVDIGVSFAFPIGILRMSSAGEVLLYLEYLVFSVVQTMPDDRDAGGGFRLGFAMTLQLSLAKQLRGTVEGINRDNIRGHNLIASLYHIYCL